MWRYGILSLIGIMWCNSMPAQNVLLSTPRNFDKIGLDDTMQVKYFIEGAEGIKISSIGNYSDFNIVSGPYQHHNISTLYKENKIVRSQSVTVTYILQPKHRGMLTIPPAIAIDSAGHAYKSKPFKIKVVRGSLADKRKYQDENDGGKCAIPQYSRNDMSLNVYNLFKSAYADTIIMRPVKGDL